MKIDLVFFTSPTFVFCSDNGIEREEAPAPGLEEQESPVAVITCPLRSLLVVVDARRGADLADPMAFAFVIVVDLDLD